MARGVAKPNFAHFWAQAIDIGRILLPALSTRTDPRMLPPNATGGHYLRREANSEVDGTGLFESPRLPTSRKFFGEA